MHGVCVCHFVAQEWGLVILQARLEWLEGTLKESLVDLIGSN